MRICHFHNTQTTLGRALSLEGSWYETYHRNTILMVRIIDDSASKVNTLVMRVRDIRLTYHSRLLYSVFTTSLVFQAASLTSRYICCRLRGFTGYPTTGSMDLPGTGDLLRLMACLLRSAAVVVYLLRLTQYPVMITARTGGRRIGPWIPMVQTSIKDDCSGFLYARYVYEPISHDLLTVSLSPLCTSSVSSYLRSYS